MLSSAIRAFSLSEIAEQEAGAARGLFRDILYHRFRSVLGIALEELIFAFIEIEIARHQAGMAKAYQAAVVGRDVFDDMFQREGIKQLTELGYGQAATARYAFLVDDSGI